jgi:hypothetical protein
MNGSHGSHWQKVYHHHWNRPHWGHGWQGRSWHGHRFNLLLGLFMLGLLFFLFSGFKFWMIPLVFFLPMFAWKSKATGWGCWHEDAMDADGDDDFERSTMKPKNGDSAAKRKNDDTDPFYPEII